MTARKAIHSVQVPLYNRARSLARLRRPSWNGFLQWSSIHRKRPLMLLSMISRTSWAAFSGISARFFHPSHPVVVVASRVFGRLRLVANIRPHRSFDVARMNHIGRNALAF